MNKFISRLKNPYFTIGLLGVIFSSAGIDFQTLTSWHLLFNAFLDIFKNPVLIVSVICALIGLFGDTRPIEDKNSNGIPDDLE